MGVFFGSIALFLLGLGHAFHDCVQPRKRSLARRVGIDLDDQVPAGCQGGLCMGMHGGPHENGNSSYVVGDTASGFTGVYAEMTVPELPLLQDGICYYLWTDVFFGDMSYGRMNQFVPQLILGNALSGSTGAPLYNPTYSTYNTWHFGAHYFFEIFNSTGNSVDAKAAYGTLYPAITGETLFTRFEAESGPRGKGPVWTLTMGVLDDPSRLSVLRVDQPYMGLGVDWPLPTTSWSELNYTNVRRQRSPIEAMSRQRQGPQGPPSPRFSCRCALTPAGKYTGVSTLPTCPLLAPPTTSTSGEVHSRRIRGSRSGTKMRAVTGRASAVTSQRGIPASRRPSSGRSRCSIY
jgi:hypothetical protein